MRRFITLALCILAAPTLARAQAVGISPGTATYAGRYEYQGQTQDGGTRRVSVSDTTIDGAHVWIVVNRLKVGDDAMLDSVGMRAGDLRPVFRRTAGDGSRLSLAMRDGVVEGQLETDEGTVRVSLRPGERSFLNYYALWAALREWPLAAGWRGTASALELNGRSEFTPLELAVEGEERIHTPAGDFDCWIVHVTGAGGIDERYWVSKPDHVVVRTREPVGPPGGMLQLDLTALTHAP
ncbi:hypothetical protein [Longimicrobium sp.]|uniref:DUF3108 domain-containing protein n=1 Tax=Longimicrobium sp. TaxID=2029185 RepID=UPI002BAF9A4E|nr:hypothetical protein [Longimicrobium sp.]HSU17319.1 hypothetical protein [Longimicrobium sp.]